MSDVVADESGTENFDADLDAGFNGEESTELTTTPEQEDEPQDQPVENEEPPVEYVQLTRQEAEELRSYGQTITSLQADNKRLFDTAFGKIGGLQQGIQQMLERKQAETSSGAKVEVTDDDMAPFADFPELSGAFRKAIENVASKMRGTGGQSFDPSLVDQRLNPALNAFKEDLLNKNETRFLARQHRDWKEVTNSAEWNAWLDTKPIEYVNQLADSWDADFVGDAISEYKESIKKTKQQNTNRQSVLEAAVAPRSSGNQSRSRTEDDDFEAGFKGK